MINETERIKLLEAWVFFATVAEYFNDKGDVEDANTATKHRNAIMSVLESHGTHHPQHKENDE